jgi:hypothetical protein
MRHLTGSLNTREKFENDELSLSADRLIVSASIDEQTRYANFKNMLVTAFDKFDAALERLRDQTST